MGRSHAGKQPGNPKKVKRADRGRRKRAPRGIEVPEGEAPRKYTGTGSAKSLDRKWYA